MSNFSDRAWFFKDKIIRKINCKTWNSLSIRDRTSVLDKEFSYDYQIHKDERLYFCFQQAVKILNGPAFTNLCYLDFIADNAEKIVNIMFKLSKLQVFL